MAVEFLVALLVATAVIQVSPRAISDSGREWLEQFITKKVLIVPGAIVREASSDQVNYMISEVVKRNMTTKPVYEMKRSEFSDMQHEIMELLHTKVLKNDSSISS